MDAPAWLTRSLADVPASDDWLSSRERETLAGLRAEKRRADWRLGRWTAKVALAECMGLAPEQLEIVASADGVPAVFLRGEPVRETLSLSHRAGRALAVVVEGGAAVGCDLEVVEPRSEAFLRTWLATRERASVHSAGKAGQERLANLIWTAKEAAAKVRRQGLRLDVRSAVVDLDWTPSHTGGWRPLTVHWANEDVTAHGWWCEEPGWLLAVVTQPASPAPVPL